jgi:hypothetical protein
MRDGQLLQDFEALLETYLVDYERITVLGIRTYSQLFAFIQDQNADPELRAIGCYALSYMRKVVDARRAIPPLLNAFKTADDDHLRQGAAHALGMLKSRRAVQPLLDILNDRTQPVHTRHWAIDSLALIGDKRALPLFRQIIDDTNEPVALRGYALELLFEEPDPVDRFIELLSDPSPDIRFWAAYCLSSTSPLAALAELDRVAAYDHTLPDGWGWQVSREAILSLETIYYRKLRGTSDEIEDSHDWYGQGPMYLISPAPEYDTLHILYRKQVDAFTYTSDPLPDIQLSIDPNWLAEQLRTAWPEIQFNVRQPRPQAYLLDWSLQTGGTLVIGALHRDGYAVTAIANDEAAIMEFAVQYRQFFPAEQRLYMYEWSDFHFELKCEMTAEALRQIYIQRKQSFQLQLEDLTFA